MKKPKKAVVLRGEPVTDKLLREFCEPRGARVNLKMGLKDVLPIEGSGISDDLFRYALMAHYDFVVLAPDHAFLFGVEYDGRDRSPKQLKLDGMKNELSAMFGFKLFRIEWEDLKGNGGQQDRLTQLVEEWFANPTCPTCMEPMAIRKGEHGLFFGCGDFWKDEHKNGRGGSRTFPKPPGYDQATTVPQSAVVAEDVPPYGGNVVPLAEEAVTVPTTVGEQAAPPPRPQSPPAARVSPPPAREEPATATATSKLRTGLITVGVIAALLAAGAMMGLFDGTDAFEGNQSTDGGATERTVDGSSSPPLSDIERKQAYVDSLSESDYPDCPTCQKRMEVRHNRSTNKPFFGCEDFPRCRGTREVEVPEGGK